MPARRSDLAVWPDGLKPVDHFIRDGVVSYQPALSLLSCPQGATKRDVIVGFMPRSGLCRAPSTIAYHEPAPAAFCVL